MSKPIHVSRAMPHSGEFTCPVPVHEDSGLTVIKSQVPCSKLLIAKEGSVLAAVECQISHETTRTIVHEDALQRDQSSHHHIVYISYLLSIGRSSISPHVEGDVLEGSSLSNLPMNTSTGSHRHGSKVEDEVPNLTIEVVLIGVPVPARTVSDHINYVTRSVHTLRPRHTGLSQ